MDLNIKAVEDMKELRKLKSFMLKQPQYYPNFREWVDGKCIPRIESGNYKNIIVLSKGIIVGNAVYRHLGQGVELKNFRIDPEYRRRDLGHFLLRQIEADNPLMPITGDITVDNFQGVQFFIRNGFDIREKLVLYRPGQYEYIIDKHPAVKLKPGQTLQ